MRTEEEKKKARKTERARKWRADNPEYFRKWRVENPEYRERKREAERKRYAEDPEYRERKAEQSRKWYEDPANRARERDLRLQRDFGINTEQFREMLASQDYKCAACPQELEEGVPHTDPKMANVDHCHDTERVRGILCRRCNIGFGFYEAMTPEQHDYLTHYQLRNDHLDVLVQ